MKAFSRIFILLLAAACNSPASLENFDSEMWKKDTDACNSIRTTSFESLLNQKEKLMGLSEEGIIATLGNPDETRLYRRTQKFLVYYTSPGPKCKNAEEKASRLEIRISALNTANEIIHYP